MQFGLFSLLSFFVVKGSLNGHRLSILVSVPAVNTGVNAHVF